MRQATEALKSQPLGQPHSGLAMPESSAGFPRCSTRCGQGCAHWVSGALELAVKISSFCYTSKPKLFL